MTTVISDFEKRVVEIELYFKFIESVINENAALYFEQKRNKKIQQINPELIKVLKANLFVLLYNLAESSIKLSLEEIYDSISSKNKKYIEVCEEIKKIWIKTKYNNFRNTGTNSIFQTINNMAQDVIEIRFDSEKLISGNIDGRKIKEFASQHGFSSKVSKYAKDGVKLHQVKTQRNSLAHGNESFAECGRRYTITELKEIKHEVIIYLRRILNNIKKYLDNNHYFV